MFQCIRAAIIAIGLLGSSAMAQHVSDYTVSFGPFIGGGEISNGAAVRHTSGYSVAAERNWLIGDDFAIGPRIEMANAFFNTRSPISEDGKSIATYDNRIFAAGVRISHAVGNDHTFAQGVYLTAVGGRAYSKLAIDDSTEESFTQSHFGNINGDYYASELGGFIPLKGSFGLNLAFLGSIYRADQSSRQGSYATDGVDSETQVGYSLAGSTEPKSDGLDDRIVMKTWAARIGIQLGF